MYAFLFKSTETFIPQVTQPLKIADKNVRFLIGPIQDHAELQSNQNGDEWLLTFFKNSDFERKIGVKFSTSAKCNFQCVAKAAFFDNGGNKQGNQAYQPQASEFARGSTTALSLDNATALTTGRYLLMDRTTCLYFSFDRAQFQRIVVCLALAAAYADVFSTSLKKMTANIKANQSTEVLALYKKILKFNAADYFSGPISFGAQELLTAWGVIFGHFQLRQSNEDLTEQLSRVATMLSSEAEQAQRVQEALRQVREQKQVRLVTIIGLAITAASALQLVQLTPQHFREAKKNWSELVSPASAKQQVTRK